MSSRRREAARRRWDDDDDDGPVYRGDRVYESPVSSLGEMVGDMVVSAKNAVGDMKEGLAREARRGEGLGAIGQNLAKMGESIKEGAIDLGERAVNEWNKASDRISESGGRADGQRREKSGERRMLGNMPPGCFCDMRGYALSLIHI